MGTTGDEAALRFDHDLSESLETLPAFVRHNGRTLGDRVTMRTWRDGQWSGLTWSEVASQVEQTAAGLLDLGVEDSRTGYVIGTNSAEFLICEYALQSLGVIAFPLFAGMSTSEMQAVLGDYRARVAFAGSRDACERLLSIADSIGLEKVVQWAGDPYDDPKVISLEALQKRGALLLNEQPDAVDARIDKGHLDDIACIILTSGTTGTPKGVLGTHRYLLDIAARYREVYAAQPFDSYLSYLPPAFSPEQYGPLALGAALPLDTAFAESAGTIERDVLSAQARLRYFGPRQWEELRASLPTELLADQERLLAERDEVRTRLGLQHIRIGVSAGGSVSEDVVAFYRTIGLPIRSVYGLAEAGIFAATRDGDPLDSVGGPLVSPYGDGPIQLKVDSAGEILMTGGVRCAGYWGDKNQLKLTDDGWLRSGDAGEWDGQVLRVLDRIDNIQRLPDGTSFAPQPLEIAVSNSPYIANLVLIGGRGDDSRIAAIVQFNDVAVRRHLFDDGREDATYAELAREAAVAQLVAAELAKVNAGRPASQHISLLALLPKSLSSDDGELTQSMKLRRTAVVGRYDPLLAALYEGSGDGEISFDLYVGRDGEGSLVPVTTRMCHVGR